MFPHLRYRLNTVSPNRLWRAAAAVILASLCLTVVGALAVGRYPHGPGSAITVLPATGAGTSDMLWQLRRLDNVERAVAVYRGSLLASDIKGSGWSAAWFYAVDTDIASPSLVPPDPTLGLQAGRLPDVHSQDEVVLGYELAKAMRLSLGSSISVQDRPFTVVGIYEPSTYLPGNYVQLSSAAAHSLAEPPSDTPLRYIVFVTAHADLEATARDIWNKLPDVQVVSPQWIQETADHGRTVLCMALGGALALALLLALPPLSMLSGHGWTLPVLTSAAAAPVGISLGWIVSLLGNAYASRTMALSVFALGIPLAIAAQSFAMTVGALSALARGRFTWQLGFVTCGLLLVVSCAAMVSIGTLNESLTLALAEARRTAEDWVGIADAPADAALLRDVSRLPGNLGLVIEAYGGLANEEEARWLGHHPPSGVFYGLEYHGGQGSLTVPYRLGYSAGVALDPDVPLQAVVGYDVARANGWHVGDSILVRDTPFVIAGIREHLACDPSSDTNYRIDISLDDLRRVLRDPSASGQVTLLVPPARDPGQKTLYLAEAADRLRVSRLSTVEDRLAEIVAGYPGTATVSPAGPSDTIRHARSLYQGMLIVCAALVLAAVAVAANAAMSERLTHDEVRIAVLKAVGADEGRLLGEYVQLAALQGLAGAVPGLLVGSAVVILLNTAAPDGTPLLSLSAQLLSSSFFLTVIITLLASLAPISQAIRQAATRTLFGEASERKDVRCTPEPGLG